MTVSVEFKRLHPEAKLPAQATPDSVGYDIYACEDTILQPQTTGLISSGFEIAVPVGYEAQVRSRSGMALKQKVFVLNSPGTVDSDYRGMLGVILYNLGHEHVVIKKGDRVAQLVIKPVITNTRMTEVEELTTTVRGTGGFGSTGK